MRLVCPNCDAQYEVDSAAIPDTGRDVQCSNCGHAWFQAHPETEELASVTPVMVPETRIPVAAEVKLPPGPPAAASVPDQPEDAGETAEAEPPALQFQRRPSDESVLAVLREEAEREVAVRKVEAPRMVETQPDLGLQQAPVPPSVLAARERFKDLSVDAADEDDADASRPASRRELLPDIEEINSTLRAGNVPRVDTDDDEEETPQPVQQDDRRKGFRSGFMLMLTLSVGLWMAYAMAPRIVEQIPGSAPAMDAYVIVINKARLGMDSALQSASKSLRSLSGQDG